MKRCIMAIPVVILSGFLHLHAQVQSLTVLEKSGNKTTSTLAGLRKMTFSSANLAVEKKNGTSASYALANIRHLSFDNGGISALPHPPMNHATPQNRKIQAYQLFFNPAGDILNVRYPQTSKSGGVIEILSVQGKILFRYPVRSDAGIVKVNLSRFPKGLYICKINDHRTTETIRFLK